MRRAVLPLALLLAAIPPAAAQIGINGTRQAATTGPVDIPIGPLSRCGRNSSRVANAMAGRAARGVARERLAIDERRLRYAGGGLTEAEEAALAARERRLDAEAGRAYRRPSYYEAGVRRRHAAERRRAQHSC